jgi:hypothetical protein
MNLLDDEHLAQAEEELNHLLSVQHSDFEPLTDHAKAKIRADFAVWSGGSPPDECDQSQRDAYVRSAMSAAYNPVEVLQWFATLGNESAATPDHTGA